MTVSYDDVAKWLPPDIRESIEVSLPCPESANGQHMWQEDRVEFDRFGAIVRVRVEPFWWCDYCKAGTSTRPIPAVNRPWAIITAEQFLKETS